MASKVLAILQCLILFSFSGCALNQLPANENKTVVHGSTARIPEDNRQGRIRPLGFPMHWGGSKGTRCLDCHVDHTRHAEMGRKGGGGAGVHRCLSCHQGCGARLRTATRSSRGCLGPIRFSGPGPIPAKPLLITACNLCHPREYKEFSTYTTMHSQLSCTTCHHVWHGVIPRCTQCHPPHGAGLNNMACTKCHPPHMVLRIRFPAGSPNNLCTGCHRGVYRDMKEAGDGHRALSCISCHPGEHGTTKRCIQCHKGVHKGQKGKGISAKYYVCTRCHGQAHALIVHPREH